MKKYRIGELAKRMCVTLDFIRFYEEKGIIESTVDEKNNYHYYDISQSEIIHKIQQYRRLGYNVNETIDLIKNMDREQKAAMYASRAAAHMDSLKMTSYAAQYLRFLQTALTTENGTWYITRLPPIWFLAHTRDDDYMDDLPVQSAYSEWANQVPLIYSIDKWEIDPNGALKAICHGIAVDASVAEDFDLHPSSFELFPERRCLEYYLDFRQPPGGNPSPSIDLRTIQPALDIVREKQFEIDGDVFVRLVASYRENDHHCDRFLIYIPIR